MGWTYALPNPWEPESVHGSYSYGVLPDNFPTLQHRPKQEMNDVLYIDEVGVDLELVFMPMEMM